MQGLDISHQQNYPPMNPMDMGGHGQADPMHFDSPMDNSGMPPAAPGGQPDQSQMAAWFDTDLWTPRGPGGNESRSSGGVT